MPDQPISPHLSVVDWSDYDFVDLGCSSGGSIGYCTKRFGANRGLGIDLDAAKVAAAREGGVDVVLGDATALSIEKKVRFVSMLDFLEHLPDLDAVERALGSAATAATDFLYVKHPSFEGKEYAESLGFRQYWWHWHGHTAHIRVSDYCAMFDALGLGMYKIRYIEPVVTSQHPSIITTDSPIDRSRAWAAEFIDKPRVTFDRPLWRRQDLFVALRAFEPTEWEALTKPMPADVAANAAASVQDAEPSPAHSES